MIHGRIMSLLSITILIACSGEPFKESESKVEQGNYQAASSGSGPEDQTSGGEASQPHPSAGSGGQPSPDAGGRAGAAGSGGASAMAGGPAMGEGGEGGIPTSGGSSSIRECLANHQTLECARVCDSQPTCQGILDCFVRTNSDLTTDCPGFSNEGYSLALEAERNCCNG